MKFTNFLICCFISTSAFSMSQDIPEQAVADLVHFIESQENRVVNVRTGPTTKEKKPVRIGRYVVIIDFSQKSDQERFYLLDRATWTYRTFRVTHGEGSGDVLPNKFLNTPGSKSTSLGFYLTGGTYNGKFGYSLKLYGLEDTNDRAYERAVVMHGADYASETFFKEHGKLGTSEGCPALDPKYATEVIDLLKAGSVIYAYHPVLDDLPEEEPAPIQDKEKKTAASSSAKDTKTAKDKAKTVQKNSKTSNDDVYDWNSSGD